MKKERILCIIVGVIIVGLGITSYFYNILIPATMIISVIELLLIMKLIKNKNVKYILLILGIILLITATMYTIINIL